MSGHKGKKSPVIESRGFVKPVSCLFVLECNRLADGAANHVVRVELGRAFHIGRVDHHHDGHIVGHVGILQGQRKRDNSFASLTRQQRPCNLHRRKILTLFLPAIASFSAKVKRLPKSCLPLKQLYCCLSRKTNAWWNITKVS